MLKKFFSVQKILDALFDDSWCSLCLPEEDSPFDWPLADPV
jgi:hypothetical protein